MHRWLEKSGVKSDDIVLDTGSGLSRKTQITLHHLVVLRAAGFTSKVGSRKPLDDLPRWRRPGGTAPCAAGSGTTRCAARWS